MKHVKGKNYSYFENVYHERNYPYIPIHIECKYSEHDKVDRLSKSGIISIYDMSDEKDYVRCLCLMKDLDMVSKKMKLEYDVTGKSGNEYLDWLHDGLCDEFYDLEVEKRSNVGFVNDMVERKTHRVIHFILDNIDKYYGYFMKCDFDYEWLYALYDDAKEGYIDSKYKIVEEM